MMSNNNTISHRGHLFAKCLSVHFADNNSVILQFERRTFTCNEVFWRCNGTFNWLKDLSTSSSTATRVLLYSGGPPLHSSGFFFRALLLVSGQKQGAWSGPWHHTGVGRPFTHWHCVYPLQLPGKNIHFQGKLTHLIQTRNILDVTLCTRGIFAAKNTIKTLSIYPLYQLSTFVKGCTKIF